MNILRITKDGFQGNLEGTASYAKVSGKVGDYSADVLATRQYVEDLFKRMLTNSFLGFFCIEPVTVTVNQESTTYPANTNVYVGLNLSDELKIETSSNKSIQTLTAWPGALSEYYDWLEGVSLFSNILFDMNSEEMYTHWSQGQQGQYRVQFAQYVNCIFWSDNPWVSDVSKRTNYTLYSTFQLPLCYSSIPDNTFKAFYCAYGVTCDPNWSNQAYKDSFAKATWATQVFSYYGLHSIGVFDMDSPRFNITLPKDCRGLMFAAGNILNAGVFDAVNTTTFGAKSGSWREAFGLCHMLKNLYIKNLKVNLNISWSPVNQESLNFILDSAANTKAITISLSPYTYYMLTDVNRQLATEKNITLELITTNYSEDRRVSRIEVNGDGSQYLSNDGTYKTIVIPEVPSLDGYAKLEDIPAIPEIPTVPTKVSEFENDSDYVSRSEVERLIAEAIANLGGGDTPEEPDTPEDPDIPEEPEVPEEIGSIDSTTNDIVVDETQLSAGTYTLRYIDENGNIVDNFTSIATFEIN